MELDREQDGKVEELSLLRGCLNVTVAYKIVAALCDTGASNSAIKFSFLEHLDCLDNPVFAPCSVFIYLTDTSLSVANNSVTLKFRIGSQESTQNFKIMP
jgi:hypothetical protein